MPIKFIDDDVFQSFLIRKLPLTCWRKGGVFILVGLEMFSGEHFSNSWLLRENYRGYFEGRKLLTEM